MPNIKTLIIVILALALAIVLVYLVHSLYIIKNEVVAGNAYVNSTKYDELLNNYTNLLVKYTTVLQELNECMANEGSIQYQDSLNHREIITSNLVLNATLSIMNCNSYSLQSTRELYFETKEPGYLEITYRLSNPQVISGSVSYYVYIMAQAMPSIPMTAVYTYESSTYAYEAGQYGQLIVPLLPNSTYTLTLGFTCYATEYYPPTNAGTMVNGEIPESAVVNVTYVW
ncbi:hypothetical protein [Vulcanisaeta souniana]|uniref:Uncharacterized protein n=1 Tax=Vulcanisaeta souniana JCM 11219 TaxID=1293586 RepID=A0A830ECU8_9CREN|nr:hypothetical protein [Vulcanisaeta souniana]BDR91201.1 hypothetical protein Vsou_02940 [Vulcanisaeta souniana JCM 11219]GGI86559.1 hypothetical protein GCM10007112_24440 [Vulcanisaeta souniana JCM 11219]